MNTSDTDAIVYSRLLNADTAHGDEYCVVDGYGR